MAAFLLNLLIALICLLLQTLVARFSRERRELRAFTAQLQTHARIEAATRAALEEMREAVRQSGRSGVQP